jgi:hypothetical protein
MVGTTCRSPRAELERRWATIRSKLEAHADDLATQGVLASRVASGRRVWRVRLVVRAGGRRVHRSIYVGGDDQPELLGRACRLLELYRAQGRWAGEVAAFARFAVAFVGLARRPSAPGRPGGRHAGRSTG